MSGLSIQITDDLIQAIAERVVELLDVEATQADGASGDAWLNVKSAAEYLDCPTSRIYDLVALGDLDPERDGRRLLFRRSDLDAYVCDDDPRVGRHR